MTTRPREQIQMDVREGIRLNELHRRWYRKLKFSTTFVSLLGGSAALMSIAVKVPSLAVAAALVVAACGFADVLGQWSDKAARRSQYIDAYRQLLHSKVTDQEMEDGLQRVFAMVTDSDIEALRAVAHNDNALSFGWDHLLVDETTMQRMWRALA